MIRSARKLRVASNFCIMPTSESLIPRDFADQEDWVESALSRGQNKKIEPPIAPQLPRGAPPPGESRPFITRTRGENDYALEQDSFGCLGSCVAVDR